MKKYGKYDKKPKAKSILLQTYFTSLLSLVLCVAMFLGTSYAWFVSEVNNTGNEIYIGILDVELEKKTGENKWESLSATKEDGSSKITLFNNEIRWEPGVTQLETVKVINKGDLAFKYVLSFTDGALEKGGTKIADSTKLAQVAQYFDVWVYDHTEQNVEPPKEYADITAADSGWKKVTTLDKLLAGEPVLTGTMDQVRKAGQNADAVNAGTTDGLKTEKIHTVALHMNEDAVTEVMGHKISLNVKLIAYQAVSEKDAFGNGSYDELGYVSTVEGLTKAIEEAKDGDVIAVAPGTYDLTEKPLVINKSIALQGLNPKEKPVLQFLTADDRAGAHGIEIKADNVKLKDLKLSVDPTKDSSGNLVQITRKADGSYYSDIVIDGCEFSGSDHCIAMYGNNVTIKNCILDESTADDQGNILYVWGTTGELVVENNVFIGNAWNKHGISFYNQSDASKIAGNIRIEGNTFNKVYEAIVHESNMTYSDVSVEILNNKFADCLKKPIAIDNGIFLSYKIHENVFLNIESVNEPYLYNKKDATIDASGNYWGYENPEWALLIYGENVTVKNYYTDEAKTNLKNK